MKFKLNTPLPQTLPRECSKACRTFQSFVDTRNKGLDYVIPRSVLQHANGFAFLSVFKAGFVISARAGSGLVIAKLGDGSWSAPSAIGTGGMGFGSQAGAEVTDFLIILNSPSAVRSFMSSGSLTLGGNMSIAVGPLGRSGEASGALNTKGKVATMYSYSKTRGLFGGVSLEGSVIVERQDANALAYHSSVSAKMLLSGAIPPPEWSRELILTLENCVGNPGGHAWIHDGTGDRGYVFGGVGSPSELPHRKKAQSVPSFPPISWGINKSRNSNFRRVSEDASIPPSAQSDSLEGTSKIAANSYDFPTQFESDFLSSTNRFPTTPTQKSTVSEKADPYVEPHFRSLESLQQPLFPPNPFLQAESHNSTDPGTTFEPPRASMAQKISPPVTPSQNNEGIVRVIGLHDFKAIEPGDLGFSKGDVIVVTEMSESKNSWWTGTLKGKKGIFPANFVELV